MNWKFWKKKLPSLFVYQLMLGGRMIANDVVEWHLHVVSTGDVNFLRIVQMKDDREVEFVKSYPKAGLGAIEFIEEVF